MELYEIPIPTTVSMILAYVVCGFVILCGLGILWDIVAGATRDHLEEERRHNRKLTPREAAMGRHVLDALDELIDETEEGLPLGRHDLSEDAEMSVGQAERMLRSQRYGPDDEAGQIAINTLTLLAIIAAAALIVTIGGAAIADWFINIVAALTN